MNDFTRLTQLPGTVQEKAWLRERIETLSVKESYSLAAALQKSPAQSMADAINHLLALPDYEVCSPAGSYEQLGAFCLKYESSLPHQLHEYIDMEQLGMRYEDDHPGLFIGNCYVRYPDEAPALQYDGTKLDQLTDDSWSVKLRLGSPYQPEGVWLRLPDYQDANDGKPDEIAIALRALKVARIDECALFEVKCIFPQLGDLIHEYDSIADLIYDGQNLGFVLDERGQGMRNFMELYQAALDYEGCDTLSEALDIAENLNRYELVPLSGLKDYAKADLQKRGVKLTDAAASAFDFERYAVEERGLILTEDGQAYIGKVGAIPRHDRTMDALPSMVLE